MTLNSEDDFLVEVKSKSITNRQTNLSKPKSWNRKPWKLENKAAKHLSIFEEINQNFFVCDLI